VKSTRHVALLPFAFAIIALAKACTPANSPGSSPSANRSAPAPIPALDDRADARASEDATTDAAAADATQPLRERKLDESALARLVEDARASDSDALIVVKDDRLMGKWLFGKRDGPIQTMSITKSVLSLAVGTLVDQGKLRLDQPVASLYPEWSRDDRKTVTVEHLLTHTSGIEEGDSTMPIYQSADFVRFALRSKLTHPPGTHYEYGNRAANLLSGVIARASKMATERYVAKVLFEPMAIKNFWWSRDRAGQAHGMAGLHLLPSDLAKLGQLVLTEGRWEGKQLVSSEWIRRSTAELAPVQPDSRRLGRLWWLVPQQTERVIDDEIVQGWRDAGVDPAFIERVAPLRGRKFNRLAPFLDALRGVLADPTLKEWNESTWKRGLPDVRYHFGPIVGCYSAGTLGQYLVVLPRDALVAVRMRRMPKDRKERDDLGKTFPDFVERVQGLVGD